jgi:hypothetical protein
MDETTEFTVWQGLRHTANLLVRDRGNDLRLIADAVDRYEEAATVPSDPEKEDCWDSLDIPSTYVLIMSTLVGHPELASPELLDGMLRSAQHDGMLGVYGFVADWPRPDDDEYPGLAELKDIVVDPSAISARSAREEQLREQLARVEDDVGTSD